MDLSLATDSYSNAYLHHHHGSHHLQQQQQQQQQQQHHLQYHQSQHPQALSLAPPSGKGFYDLESTEHAGAVGATSNSLGLGHLGASSSYQPDYGLSSYTAGAATASSSAAAGASLQHSIVPSYSPGQPWSRNSNSTHGMHVGPSQHSLYSAPSQAAPGAHILHSTGFSEEAHPLGSGASAVVDRSLQYASLHGWGGSESNRSQWSQHFWDNCLPPGVEPAATAVPNPLQTQAQTQTPVPTHLQAHPHPHPHPHPHLHPQMHPQANPQVNPQVHPQVHLQMYRHLQQYPSIGANVKTGRPGPRVWPRKKPAKVVEKKIPVVKTSVMKEAGVVKGLTLEKGPGWCFVCQRNCVTEVALKQHLDGKGHKRMVERQQEKAELVAKTVDEDGGGVASMLEQMWVQVSMMGKPARTGKSKKKPRARDEPTAAKPKAEEEPADVKPTDPNLKPEEESTSENLTGVQLTNAAKALETVRCDLCGVECNSQLVLEIHFGGKKHAARLKKAQESAVACEAQQTTSMGQ